MIKRIWFFLAFLWACFSWGQETVEGFYDKLEKAYGNESKLRSLNRQYFKEFQKSKSKYRLAFLKLSEIYLYREDTIGNLKRSYEIMKLSQENSEIKSRALYEAAVFLENSSLDLSLNYLKEAVRINEENSYEFSYIFSYHILGRNYYKRGDYKKAMYYFTKVLHIAKAQKNHLSESSMYNNMGLVSAKQKNYPQAISFARKSISILVNAQVKSNLDLQFLNLVKNNLADSYFRIKDYEKAKFYWTEAFRFYQKNPIFKRDLEGFISKFYAVSQSNQQETEIFVEQLKPFLDQEHSKPLNLKILEILQNHAIKSGNISEIEKFSALQSQYYRGYKKSAQQDRAEVVRILNKYMIEGLKREREIDRKEDRFKSWVLYLALAFLGSAVYYFYRIREIDSKKKTLLEKENQFMQERAQHLSLNLKLKSQAEKEFYNRVKKMKVPMSKGAEEVIKELKMSFFNLLEIDKRLDGELVKDLYQDHPFFEALKKKYPQLNEQERQLCGYLKLKLSAKEISMLQGLTPESVYVYKNKIKNKLGLGREDALEEFLNKI